MKAIRILVAAAAAAGLATAGMTASASAAPAPQALTCNDGYVGSGTYASLTVNGWCTVQEEATVRVQGNVTVRNDAYLDVEYATLKVQGGLTLQSNSDFRNGSESTTRVFGNVTVGKNAYLGADTSHSTFRVDGDVSATTGAGVALGCTEEHPCSDGGGAPELRPSSVRSGSFTFVQVPILDNVSVGGDVDFAHVYNAAIDGVAIGGSLTSSEGGAGPNAEGFIPFSVKDDVIGGNVQVVGLNTTWFGIIRSKIGGSVSIAAITNSDPDGNEVVANKIAHNLTCFGDSPAAQYGDAIDGGPFPGYGPNKVGGAALGECAALTKLPVVSG